MSSEHHSMLKPGQQSYDSIPEDDVHSEMSSIPPPPPSQSNTGYSHGAISLDFERVVNEYSIQACRDRMNAHQQQVVDGKRNTRNWNSNKREVGHAGRSATQWTLTLAAGLLTGLTTIFIVSVTEELVLWRARRLSAMITDPEDPNLYVFLRFSPQGRTLLTARNSPSQG